MECGFKKREEVRRAHDSARLDEDAAREAEHAGEVRSKEVAEKIWQALQSGCKKVDNLDKD